MKKMWLFMAALAALAMPAASFACHVVDVEGNADCNGWSLCATVYFTSSVDSGYLEYTVAVIDGSGEPVTGFAEGLIITHEPGAGNFEYCFSGYWDGTHSVSNATVIITASLDEVDPVEFTFYLDCTLAEDAMTFGGVKAMYR